MKPSAAGRLGPAIRLLLGLSLLAGSAPALQGLLPQAPAGTLVSWTLRDLRALDPPDAASPTSDILAAYTRLARHELHLRLDLLEMDSGVETDFYLAFDFRPGGTRQLPLQGQTSLPWDLLIVIPGGAAPQALRVYQAQGDSYTQLAPAGLRTRVLRDPLLDTLSLSLDAAGLDFRPWQARIEVLSAAAHAAVIADRLPPFESSGSPPQPVNLLLAFSSAYPVYTPALALRRWNGAHTGPAGGRHGLFNLLRSARSARVPVLLLDLNSPSALAGLAAVGGLDLVRQMEQEGLLLLADPLPATPAPLPDWAVQQVLARARQARRRFGLQAGSLIFAPPGVLPAPPAPRLGSWRGRPLLQLPAVPAPGSQPLELAGLELRRALVLAALAAQQQPPGEVISLWQAVLPASAWGDPAAARQAFAYLKAHPWIRFASAQELRAGSQVLLVPAPAAAQDAPQGAPGGAAALFEAVLAALRSAPDNALGSLAWDSLIAQWGAVYPAPAELAQLRLSYLGDVQALLAGAHWAEIAASCPENGLLLQPGEPAAGARDPAALCRLPAGAGGGSLLFLARSYMAVFAPGSAGLSHLFALDALGQPHQLLGPTSQLAAGLGEPLFWQAGAGGSLRDPAVLDGIEFLPALQAGDARFQDQVLRFATPQGQVEYQLGPGGLVVHLHSQAAGQLRLALLLDAQARLSPHAWELYQMRETPEKLSKVWQLESDPSHPLLLRLQGSAPLSSVDFSDSQQLLRLPEDPNREIPPGHYLPIPFALVTMEHAGEATLSISLQAP